VLLTCAFFLIQRLDAHVISLESNIIITTYEACILTLLHDYILLIVEGILAFKDTSKRRDYTSRLVFSTVAYKEDKKGLERAYLL
jgi:hypothetical protein